MSVAFILDAFEDIHFDVADKKDLLKELIKNSSKTEVNISDESLKKIVSGERDIPKKIALAILDKDNIDEKGFQESIEEIVNTDDEDFNRDTLSEKLSKNPYGVNTDSLDTHNVSLYFSKIWFKYLKLSSEKEQHRSTKKKVVVSEEDIEERIKKVIDAFQTFDEEKTDYTDAKRLKEKLDKTLYKHLYKKIENNIMDFFAPIQSLIKEKQESEDCVFEQIRRKVKNRYLKEEKNNPNKVFNNLVDWLMMETYTDDREACEAIISFFVRDCEVF